MNPSRLIIYKICSTIIIILYPILKLITVFGKPFLRHHSFYLWNKHHNKWITTRSDFELVTSTFSKKLSTK